MEEDDDIPVLTQVVRRPQRSELSAEQVDELCDSLTAAAWVLIDGLIAEALRDVEERLRVQINDRLGDELPPLIENTLREKLGGASTD